MAPDFRKFLGLNPAEIIGKAAVKSMPSALSSIYFIIFCLMVLVFPCSLRSQQYRFDSYGQAEGLNDLGAKDIAFDKKGFLWVATRNGLFRFLGPRFEYYGREQGLIDRDVLEVYVDPYDRVWAVTTL